jgi:8-oxo-dGTP pyrophosphatase MutT (NUDIX family)
MTEGAPLPKPAATVLLVRDAPHLEVLMVRRSSGMAFGASAWVFPGGKVAPADADESWREHADGAHDPYQRSLRIAAARETFEESGLLLAVRLSDGQAPDGEACERLGRMRAEVEADSAVFLRMMREEGLRLTLDRLAPFAHWITPAFEPRRFDTHFFLAVAPERQVAHHDGREAIDHGWVSPSAVLEQRLKGETKLMFPTRLNLELLSSSANVAEAERSARARRIVTVEPELLDRDGRKILRIPAEAGYSLVEEAIDRVMG